MPMPDIEAALRSFQKAHENHELALKKCALDSNLFLHGDMPNGEPRLTYVRLDGPRVLAMVQFIRCENVRGEPCFNVAWAVPPELRGAGRALEAFIAARKELSYGLKKAGVGDFWIEAIVDIHNKASQGVAVKAITSRPIEATDKFAGVPILQYLARTDGMPEM